MDGEYLIKKEMEFQEKGKKAEENAKDCKGQLKAHTNSVVGKGKGIASVVAGESSKFAKQKGKEALYDLPLPCIFAYSSNIYRSPLWQLRHGYSDVRGLSLLEFLFCGVVCFVFGP